MRRFYKGLVRKLSRFEGFSLIELVLVILMISLAVPSITRLYSTIFTQGHTAEFMTVANMLATEQMEIILADKAGSGEGYGYDSINSSRYSNVQPGGLFNAFSRTAEIQTFNVDEDFEYKVITVTVSMDLTPNIVLTAFVMDHEY